MTGQNRNSLKDKFKSGKLPTEMDFADLIDSGINPSDDGLVKSADTELKIRVPGKNPSEVVLRFMKGTKEDEDISTWTVQHSGGNSVKDAVGLMFAGPQPDTPPVLFLGPRGRVGVGTAEPKGKLHVDGTGLFNGGGWFGGEGMTLPDVGAPEKTAGSDDNRAAAQVPKVQVLEQMQFVLRRPQVAFRGPTISDKGEGRVGRIDEELIKSLEPVLRDFERKLPDEAPWGKMSALIRELSRDLAPQIQELILRTLPLVEQRLFGPRTPPPAPATPPRFGGAGKGIALFAEAADGQGQLFVYDFQAGGKSSDLNLQEPGGAVIVHHGLQVRGGPLVITGDANAAAPSDLANASPPGTLIIGGPSGDVISLTWRDHQGRIFFANIKGTQDRPGTA